MIMCHVCNVPSQADNLIENRFLAKLLDEENNLEVDNDKETEEEKTCTSCHDNVIATSWCVECEEFICHNCVLVVIYIFYIQYVSREQKIKDAFK